MGVKDMVDQLVLYIGPNHGRQSRLQHNLKYMGLELQKATSVEIAKEMVRKYEYCLVLIYFDIMGEEIFKLCSFIRSCRTHTLVIVLMKEAKIHIEEKLFDCGVNDIVVGRQTSIQVLTKRIKSHLREVNPHWHKSNIVRLKDTIVDLDRREVRRNGSCYQLRGILADLLKYFLDNPDRVISREELLESPIWADSICTPAKEGGKTFDVNVGKLRKIIEPDPVRPQIIKSVRGVGWKLANSFIERSAHN